MKKKTIFGTSPFDILFKDFFNTGDLFAPFSETRVSHPVDIYEEDDGLNIDIACVGLSREDLDITIEGDILRVRNLKKDKDADHYIDFMQKNIAKRNFNFGWKISRRFDLSKIDAELDKGLLHLFAPLTEESKPRVVSIK